ncbi:MAG: DUF6789 family protein [Halobacteriaceae archaeon]
MATIVSGLAGGVVATVVMTIVMRALGGGPPPTANLVATFQGGDPADYMMPGLVLHLVYGTVAGGVLVAVLSAASLDVSALATWLGAGLVYGIVLMVGGAMLWVRGVIGMDPDREMMMQFAVVHVVYGLVLGAWLGYGVLG